MAEPLLTGPSSADPVDLLERLADLGLLQIRSGTPLRFRLLDVVREFGAEQRDLAGETGAVAQAHARVIVAQVSRIAPALAGAEFLAAVRQLDAIASDIRAALDYAGEHDPDLALALAASLPRWWRFRGRDREGRDLLRRLLDVADAEPRVRAWADLGTALLALEHGDGIAELPRARSALSTFVTLEDVGGQLAAHTQLVALYHSDGAYDLARSHGEASLALATRSGRRRDQLVASTNLTWHDIRTGDLRAARQRLAALRTLAGELGEQRLESLALANLAEVERLDRRFDDAVRTGRQAVRALEQQGDPRHRRNTLGTVAIALAESGRAPEARELLASLRSAASGGTGDGTFAMIEAYLALGTGDRWSAAQWFGEAQSALVGQQDVRDTVEALVGLAATAPDPDVATRARAELAEICRSSAVTLLPRDRLMLETERLGPTTSVNRPEP
jgi:tetratricopeptide (TPR) repeat protein